MKLLDAKINQCYCCIGNTPFLANSAFAVDPEWHDSRVRIYRQQPMPSKKSIYALLESWARSV